MKLNLFFILMFAYSIVSVYGGGQQQISLLRRPQAARPERPDGSQPGETRVRLENTKDPEDPSQSTHMNPISRLELMQGMKGGVSPTYELLEVINMISERGNIINKRFHVSAKLADLTSDGWGFSKKEAKRDAAKQLLEKMNLLVA